MVCVVSRQGQIERATQGGPQVVARYAKRVAVIVPAREFDRLSGAGAPLWQTLRAVPTKGVRLRTDRDRRRTDCRDGARLWNQTRYGQHR